jgi:drug/metabolite transporter (DMT)-like permease
MNGAGTQRHFLALVFCVVVLAAGQLMFKQVALNYNKAGTLATPGVLGLLAVAGFLYVVSTGVWVWALRHVEISRAYPVFALGFILVPLLGAWFFGEVLTARFLVGLALIVVGVSLTSG